MNLEKFYRLCHWIGVIFMILTVLYFGSAVIDSLPKIAKMYSMEKEGK